MRYYEKLYYKLSRSFKASIALELLNNQLNKEPNSSFKFIEFKDQSYDIFKQGERIKYEIDENTGNICVFIETEHDHKKKYILLQIRKCGNEINIVTKIPREDTHLFYIRHNSNKTVSSLSKKIKNYEKENEQVIESRYALFSDEGSLLDYNEEKRGEFIPNSAIKL